MACDPARRHIPGRRVAQPGALPDQARLCVRDFARAARFEGVPYRQPDPFPIPTQNAARVFWWLADTQGMEAASAWARAGLRAYFARGVPFDDIAALKALGQ